MLLWHIGASIAFVRYAFRDQNMDLRFVVIGAILPDLLDLPVGILTWPRFETPRLAAHSLVFAALALVTTLVVTRRGLWRKRLVLVTVGVLLHLALDGMWRDPETLWWPFLGWLFTSTGVASFAGYATDVLTNPVVWLGEAVGLVYLVVLWRRAGLSDATRRSVLYRSGVVSAPIGNG